MKTFDRSSKSNIRRSRREWGAKAVLLLFLAGAALAATACGAVKKVCNPGHDCSYIISDLELGDPKIGVNVPSGPMVSGQNLWVTPADSLLASWGKFVIYLQENGAICKRSDWNRPGCRRCDYSDPNTVETCGNYPWLFLSSSSGFKEEDPGPHRKDFLPTLENIVDFRIPENAAVQLGTDALDRGKLAEARVYILTGSRTLVYPLRRLTPEDQGVMPGEMGYDDLLKAPHFISPAPQMPLLEDAFSPSLKVGKVRILKGKLSADRATGRQTMKAGVDATVVRPSRIVPIPGFTMGQTVFSRDDVSCYANPGSTDGDIDLLHCHTVVNDAGTTPQTATPTFLNPDPRPLRWVAEFRASEGSNLPDDLEGDDLAIEFTIQ